MGFKRVSADGSMIVYTLPNGLVVKFEIILDFFKPVVLLRQVFKKYGISRGSRIWNEHIVAYLQMAFIISLLDVH